MPEPVTIIVLGAAAYAWWKKKSTTPSTPAPGDPPVALVPTASASAAGASGQPLSTGASGTGPDAPLATTTGVVNAVPITDIMTPEVQPQIVPLPPLAAVLDDDTAMKMRAYAAIDPSGFRIFLDRYADRFQLRADYIIEMINDPPQAGYQPTAGMIASMGIAAYRVVQAMNGVAAGKNVDVFGVASSVAGVIPGVNQDFVTALQGLTLGYRAYTITTDVVQSIALANGVGVMDLTGAMVTGAISTGVMPITTFSGALMAVGLCVDIAFTIIGNEPDLQKAIDVALDVASLVCLFIPVIGWVVAIVIQLVKFIIDCFGEDLFGGGLSKWEKEKIEAAHYGELLSPMFPVIAHAFSPREIFSAIVQWGSGYCGGKNMVAMMIQLNLHPGDEIMVGGAPMTIHEETEITIGSQPCYWFRGSIFENITNDEQAWALAKYGSVNGVTAHAQVGVRESLKPQFERPTEDLIKARCSPMKKFVDHGVTLDGIDLIVAEYRAQPGLMAMAAYHGFAKWQEMLGHMLEPQWERWASSITHGSLHDFAQALGYPTMYALRAAIFGPYQDLFDKASSMIDATADMITWFNANMGTWPYQTINGYNAVGTIGAAKAPLDATELSVLDAIESRIQSLEAMVGAWEKQVQDAGWWQGYTAAMVSL